MNSDEHENLVSAIEDDRIAQQLDVRPTFIPLRHTDLRSNLAECLRLDGSQRKLFGRVCDYVQAIFRIEHRTIQQEIEELYCHLDPDSELVDLDSLDEDQRKHTADRLVDQITFLLERAHFKKLTRGEIESAVEIACQWGVKLETDLELFDRIEIYARGYRTVTVKRKCWQNLYREEQIELPEFQRLIMVFRTRPPSTKSSDGKGRRKPKHPFNSNCVYLKTFKNIPETDLEILLPGSRIRLTRLDQLKILLPTLGGTFITAYKLFRSMVVLSLAITVGAILGWIFFLAATIGYIVKSILSYYRTKNKYQFDLTKSLYLKNLDNNLSVIYRILNEAEEQELCEAILAYTLLWSHPSIPKAGATLEELDSLAESFLLDISQLDVDFEVDDALAKLERLGMAQVDLDGRWQANAIDRTIEVLDEIWKRLLESKTRFSGSR